MEGLGPLVDVIDKGGLIAVLIIVLWLFLTERIVPRKRMEEWKEVAMAGRKLVNDSVMTVSEVVPVAQAMAEKMEPLTLTASELQLLRRTLRTLDG